MINFRYHVVSLTAVFLALAIGLVVGTAALNGPLSETLKDNVSSLRKQNQQYRDQVNHLTDEANKQEQFATEATPLLLGGKLTGRRVLVVSMVSASKYADGVLSDLQIAGVTVVGRMEIQDKFIEPANSTELLDLANAARTAVPTVVGLPTNSNGVETSTGLLAAVLMERSPAVDDNARRTVLSAYTNRGYIALTGETTGSAQAVLVIAGPPYVDKDAAKKNAAIVTMVAGLDQAGPIVVAGSGIGGDGNVLGQVRGDPALTKTVSTVDNVSTAAGRLVTVLALAEQLEGRAGHYGIDAGSCALLPRPVTERRCGA